MSSGGSRTYLTTHQVDMLDSLAHGRQWWTATELADDLGGGVGAVKQRLYTLRRRGLANTGVKSSKKRGGGLLWRVTKEGREALSQVTQPGDYPARSSDDSQ